MEAGETTGVVQQQGVQTTEVEKATAENSPLATAQAPRSSVPVAQPKFHYPRGHYWRCLCCFKHCGSLFVRKIVYGIAVIFAVYGIIAISFGIRILAIGTHNATVDWLFFVSPIAAWGGADDEGETNGADIVGWVFVPLLLDILPAVLMGLGALTLSKFCVIPASILFHIGSTHDLLNFLVMVLALLMAGMLECKDCNSQDFAALGFCMIVRLVFIGLRQFSANCACAFKEQINNREYDKPEMIVQPAAPVALPPAPA